MKKIPLTQGKFAIVDDEDYDFLMKWQWYAHNPYKESFYAVRNQRTDSNEYLPNGKHKRTIIRMHRIIMRASNGSQIDHINGNTLDNRKCNLRVCNTMQNCQNCKKHVSIKNTSKYKGVHLDGEYYTWVAKIRVNKKVIYLGRHKTEEMAAQVYNNAAIKYFGEFARLNEI